MKATKMKTKKLIALDTIDKEIIYKHVKSYKMGVDIPFDIDGEDEYNLKIKKLIDKLVDSIFKESKDCIKPSMADFAKDLIREYLSCNFRTRINSSIYADAKSAKENKMYISLTLLKN